MSTYVRNNRGSAWSGISFNTWQRHTAQCEARGNVTKNEGKECTGSCCGSGHRAARRFSALMTSITITGEPAILADGREIYTVEDTDGLTVADIVGASFVCPLSLDRVPIMGAHVDRVIPGALEGRYEPGNIALVSEVANLAKSDSEPDAYYARSVAKHGVQFDTVASSLPSGARALVHTCTKRCKHA